MTKRSSQSYHPPKGFWRQVDTLVDELRLVAEPWTEPLPSPKPEDAPVVGDMVGAKWLGVKKLSHTRTNADGRRPTTRTRLMTWWEADMVPPRPGRFLGLEYRIGQLTLRTLTGSIGLDPIFDVQEGGSSYLYARHDSPWPILDRFNRFTVRTARTESVPEGLHERPYLPHKVSPEDYMIFLAGLKDAASNQLMRIPLLPRQNTPEE